MAMNDAIRTGQGAVREPVRAPVGALAVAGIAGPSVFATVALLQGLLRSGHSLGALPISALAAGPNGWVQDVNFIVFGLSMIAFAAGLHLGVRPARGGALGPALLMLSGMGLVGAGVFPATDASGAFSQHQVGHSVASVVTFVATGAGLIVVSRRMKSDPRWQSVAALALATGIAVLILFLSFAALARTPGAPLHPWMGAFQWVLVATWFACTIVLAFRLRRVAGAAQVPPASRHR